MRQFGARHLNLKGSITLKFGTRSQYLCGFCASSLPVLTGSDDARWRRRLAQKCGNRWRREHDGLVFKTRRHEDCRLRQLTLMPWYKLRLIKIVPTGDSGTRRKYC